MSDSKIEIQTAIDTSGIDKGAKTIKQKLEDLSQKITSSKFANAGATLTGLTSVFSAVTGAIQGAVAAVKDLNAAYKVQKSAEIQLEQAVKNSPFLDGSATQALKDYASSIQEATNFGDEGLLPLMAGLASAGRTQAEIMEIMSVSVDVAASGVMSLDSAVKYLNSSFSGLTGELGERIPQVKLLTAEELKQGKAVELLAKTYKGGAAAQKDAFTQAANTFGDLKEQIGGLFHNLFEPFAKVANVVIGGLVSGMTEINRILKPIYESLGAIFTAFANFYNNQFTKFFEKVQKLNNIIFGQDLELADQLAAQKKELAEINAQIEAQEAHVDELKEKYSDTLDAASDTKKVIRSIDEINAAFEKATTDEERALLGLELLEAQAIEAAGDITGKSYANMDEVIAENDKRLKSLIKQFQELQAQASKGLEVSAVDVDSGGSTLNAASIALDNLTAKRERVKKQIEELEKALKAYGKTEQQGSMDAANKAKEALKAYYDTVDAKKRELAYREQYGKKLTDEEKRQELLNTMTSAYITMREAAGSALDAENKQVKEIIAELSGRNRYEQHLLNAEQLQKDTEEALKAAKEFESELQAILTDDDDISIAAVEKKYNAEMQLLLAKHDATIESAQLEAAEKERIHADYVRAVEKLEKEKTKAIEEETNKMFAKISDITQTASEVTNQCIATTTALVDVFSAAATRETDEETAELEQQYADGLISYEEYEAKKAEIDKKAAMQEYKVQLAEWALQFVSIGASTAVGMAKCLEMGMPMGAIMAAALGTEGALQTAALMMNKPTPPQFADGGYVPGTSYSGDNVHALLNSGELVLNNKEQAVIKSLMGDASASRGSSMNVKIVNNAAHDTGVQVQQSADGLRVFINKTVNQTLADGGYNAGLAVADHKTKGVALL